MTFRSISAVGRDITNTYPKPSVIDFLHNLRDLLLDLLNLSNSNMIQSERKRKRAAVYVDSRMLLFGADNEIAVPVPCVGDGKYGAIERRHAVIVYVQEMRLVCTRQCQWTK